MQSGDFAMLIQLDGPERGRRQPLVAERYIIGRESINDIVVDDRRVSRQHAEILHKDGQYFLLDLGSKNGTYLNGQRIQEATRLSDGDEIHLAFAARWTFVGTGNTMPLVLGNNMEPGLLLDTESRRVVVNGTELTPPLSLAQFRLLLLLQRAKGAVCNRDEIAEQVWPGESTDGITEQAIDALVRRLRERLAEVDPAHAYIITVRSQGFRFENRST